ncbi:LVIVD repeat-containing protein [uncultured Eubacterium sp.]|uniref:LVIVD repeat-containing protein n=1 Tax=uncultured Eubacterium sp. TaxID=165185 RepID=UPI0025EABD4D|nr:hypothetical protein [uncultured Eubacterium sp.]
MAQRKEMLMKNVEYIGYCDLNRKPGFQMAMYKSPENRYYLYAACFRDNGFNIVDVTDPSAPVAKWVEGDWIGPIHDGQSLPKIQTGDGKLITCYGGTMRVLHGTHEMPFWGGIKIYDIAADPMNPKFLGEFECEDGPGAHRSFYNGGNYVYVVGSKRNYMGYIIRIVDISDPTHPVEVGSYWDDAQFLGNKKANEIPEIGTEEFMKLPCMHAVTVKDDILYAAFPNVGFCMIDVSDKRKPRLIGKLPLNPTFGGGQGGAAVHSAMPLGDRPYAIVTTEAERVRYFSNERLTGMFHKITTQPMNMIGIVETVDPEHPSLIAICPYPEVPEGYTHGTNFNIVDGVRAVFGPHNMFDAFGQDCYEKRDDRIYNCYFHAGLRIYDVSDPFMPKEIAYFLPPDPEGENWFDNENGTLLPGPQVAITEDVLVDDRGYIYVDTFEDGLYIVKCTV